MTIRRPKITLADHGGTTGARRDIIPLPKKEKNRKKIEKRNRRQPDDSLFRKREEQFGSEDRRKLVDRPASYSNNRR